MPHFKTYCTKRIVTGDFATPLWQSVLDFEENHPEILRAVENKIVKTRIEGKDVEVVTNVWLFAGDFNAFISFIRDMYVAEGKEKFFTPGLNGFGISESSIALVPVKTLAEDEISQIVVKLPHPLPKIRSQLSSRNFLTFVEDDFPDVDIALSNNSFTLPLTEAVKLAEQILRIANYHGESFSLDQNPNSGSSSDFSTGRKTA